MSSEKLKKVRALNKVLEKVDRGELKNLIIIEYNPGSGSTVLGRYGLGRITGLISLLERAKEFIKNEHRIAHRPSEVL